jgi:large repetitive protein
MDGMKSSLFRAFLLAVFASQCAASEINITTTKVPNGTVDSQYSATIDASGGCTPYRWKLLSGKLPEGITQKASSNSTSLDLSGEPTTEATYSFTESVTSCDGSQVAYAWYQVVVQAAANHVVDLKWNASTSKDVAGYNIYRGPDGKTWTKINSGLIAATDYDDSTVSNGSTYYYSATTVNIEGEESSKSSSAKVTVPE